MRVLVFPYLIRVSILFLMLADVLDSWGFYNGERSTFESPRSPVVGMDRAIAQKVRRTCVCAIKVPSTIPSSNLFACICFVLTFQPYPTCRRRWRRCRISTSRILFQPSLLHLSLLHVHHLAIFGRSLPPSSSETFPGQSRECDPQREGRSEFHASAMGSGCPSKDPTSGLLAAEAG